VEYLLRLGDDRLVLGHRLSEWCGHAPILEEDIALANIALDQLGVARALYSLVGDEDELAFQRGDREFRNCLLVELPNGVDGRRDFGVTMAKLLFLSAYQRSLYGWLVSSADERLAGIAAKARKESAYHYDHAAQWTVRLGDGTEESHRRMQAAIDYVWPYTYELFETDDLSARLDEAGLAVAPATLRDDWMSTVETVLDEATLTRPADGGWAPTGGRVGLHTEHMSYLLAEMQVLHRAHEGATW
jgi:ring-1,2-phenylacetyl-CoA epoxidase subunit PaaC